MKVASIILLLALSTSLYAEEYRDSFGGSIVKPDLRGRLTRYYLSATSKNADFYCLSMGYDKALSYETKKMGQYHDSIRYEMPMALSITPTGEITDREEYAGKDDEKISSVTCSKTIEK